jgi:4'-phosphopantetheinyl transferase
LLEARSGALPNGIVVWALRPDDARHFEALLSESELERAARFRFDIDRQRHVVGVGAMRVGLAARLGCEPRTLSFTYGAHGKPALEGAHAFDANVSHSGAWVLVAFCERAEIAREVGVDVEAHREVDVDELAREVFTAAEQGALRELVGDPARARRAFFRTWARKEAALKAWGTGLSLAARTVEVGLDDSPTRIVRGAEHGHRDLVVEDLVLDDDHAAAVAFSRPSARPGADEQRPAHPGDDPGDGHNEHVAEPHARAPRDDPRGRHDHGSADRGGDDSDKRDCRPWLATLVDERHAESADRRDQEHHEAHALVPGGPAGALRGEPPKTG